MLHQFDALASRGRDERRQRRRDALWEPEVHLRREAVPLRPVLLQQHRALPW